MSFVASTSFEYITSNLHLFKRSKEMISSCFLPFVQFPQMQKFREVLLQFATEFNLNDSEECWSACFQSRYIVVTHTQPPYTFSCRRALEN